MFPAQALPVQGAGEDRLARPALAAQQHGNVVGGGARDDVQHRTHRSAGRGEAHVGTGVRELRLEIRDPPRQLDAGASLLDRALDLRRREGFGQVVPRAAPDRLDGRVDGRVSGDDHHLERRPF